MKMSNLMITRRHQSGAATLFMAVVLVSITTLLILFAGNHGVMMSKSVTNTLRSASAAEAAQAGLEFGIAYLIQNSSTVRANPVSGFINYGSSNSSLTNVTQANGSKYSIVYTNPTANNYQLIRITSTGVNDDGTSTRVVSQLVYAGVSSLNAALTTQGNLVTSGNVSIPGSNGVRVGGTVTQSGNVNIGSIIQNDTNLKNMTSSALFSSVFGVSTAQMQSQSTYFANTSGLNYSTLTGKNWINSSVVVSGNYTIGTPSNPVLLVINGNLIASGTMTIYGVVYVMGSTTMSGNVNFNGGMISQGAVTMSGSVGAYNSSIVGMFTSTSYAKIPGSWRDF